MVLFETSGYIFTDIISPSLTNALKDFSIPLILPVNVLSPDFSNDAFCSIRLNALVAITSSDNSKPNTENKNITVLNSDTTESNPKPKINSINKTSYKYGDTVEVRGENFYALENDKIVIIENEKGEKIYLDTIWNQWHSYISFVLPSEVCSVLEGESGIADCKDRNGKIIKIEKGAYKLYYPDFGTGELSNSVNFSIE